MIKWSTIWLLVVAVALCGCSSENDEPVIEKVERTVLIYMVATNSLGQSVTSGGVTYPRADEGDISEMTEAASALRPDQRVLVFRSTYEQTPALYELNTAGLKLLKEYDSDVSCLKVDQMRTIISDAQAIAPADNFGIVMWSHANGWLQDGTAEDSENATSKHRSFGIDRNKRMNVTDLAEALSGFDLEFIYFDCCLMGSVEVAYQLRHCAPYIVASTSELPRPGMPYDKCMPLFLKGAPAGLIESARTTYQFYRDHSNDLFRTCTISVIATAGLDRLADATRAIYVGAPLSHQGDNVTNYNATGRTGNWIDFGEYVTSLAGIEGRDSKLAEELSGEFDAAMASTVIFNASTPIIWAKYPVYHDSGLSTYVFNIPAKFTYNGYDGLDWAKDVVSFHLN